MSTWVSGESAERFVRHLHEVVLIVGVLLVLARFDLVVDTPLWVVLALLVLAAIVISAAYSRFGADCSPRQLRIRAVLQTGLMAAVVYSSGWGPTLIVVELFAVADNVRYSGARAVRPVLVATVGWVFVGQVLLHAGLVPSGVPAVAAHGGATITTVVMAFVAGRIGRMTLAKERAEAELRTSEERFRALVQEASDVIMVIADARITYVSPSCQRVLGYAEEELVGSRYADLIHPDDLQQVSAEVIAMLERPGSTGLIECRLRHADGHWIPFETSNHNRLDDPRIRGFVSAGRDISERKALESELEHRAFHDALTGLANRALFRDRVEHTVARTQRSTDARFGVLYLDLDGFKIVNDTLGHAVGDALLQEVAERLRPCIRDADTAARLGGDEFALLLEDTHDDSDPARVARRILDALREPFLIHGNQVKVDASIGIAVNEPGITADELLRNADIAMYMAKNSGRGRFELFEPSMHLAVVERLELEADLQRALDRGEFLLHYQPIVDLNDGRVVGIEALVRWSHPERGMVSPGDFIPLAEESGLIIPLGRWVLDEACRQVKEWQDRYPTQPPLHVSVNVSMRQVSHGDVVGDVRAALARTGLDAAQLILELTESALVQDADSTIRVLHELKGLGVRLAIDDFGTGYSSLSYLQRFPVDVLKIDRSFVEGMVNGSQNPALIRAIVQLGHSLRLQTVAEGIEHDEELSQCRALRCHLGQGYFFARPSAGDAIEALLARMTDGTVAELRERVAR